MTSALLPWLLGWDSIAHWVAHQTFLEIKWMLCVAKWDFTVATSGLNAILSHEIDFLFQCRVFFFHILDRWAVPRNEPLGRSSKKESRFSIPIPFGNREQRQSLKAAYNKLSLSCIIYTVQAKYTTELPHSSIQLRCRRQIVLHCSCDFHCSQSG